MYRDEDYQWWERYTPEVGSNSWLKSAWCDRCNDLQKHFNGKCTLCNSEFEIECQDCYAKFSIRCYGRFRAFKFCSQCLRKRYETHRRALYLTIKGQAQLMYGRIRARCRGKTKNKYARKYYKGMPYMSREEFYEVVFADKKIIPMAEAFLASNKDFKLAPSVNRINPKLGYIHGNIEFITLSENAKLANHSRRKPKRKE